MRCAASPFLCSNKHSHCLSSCVNNIVCSSLVLSVACRVCVLSWKMLNQLTPPLINKIKKKKNTRKYGMHACMDGLDADKKNKTTKQTEPPTTPAACQGFQCTDGLTCLDDASRQCDGRADCPDFSDELNCPQPPGTLPAF